MLRPTQSEMGEVDPAAIFEFKKSRVIEYLAGDQSSCLVEADEEPPHDLNWEAVKASLLISLALKAKPVDELHVMRKIVIDGSNTTGFQRTLIVALGGELDLGEKRVKVQTVSLEEDAARLQGEWERGLRFGLDRLCIPLVEVALEPVQGSPQEIQEIALSLGRLMRLTGKAARGLGTIRQDLNISLQGQGIVEVKGVQKLDLLAKIVDYEVRRQRAFLKLSLKLREGGVRPEDISEEAADVTGIFLKTQNRVLKNAVESNGVILGIKLPKFAGLLSYEFEPNIRLGREMAEMVRFYGLGGIFHSDEVMIKGILDEEVSEVRRKLALREEDAFVLVAGRTFEVEAAMMALIGRAKAAVMGVPSETRAPTAEGATRYSRPRPGSARMYPETDIPPIPIPASLIEELTEQLPRSWEEQIRETEERFGLGRQLAVQIFDSEYKSVFEKIVSTAKMQASFVAATLTETLVNLEREGGDLSRLSEEVLGEVFVQAAAGQMSKEAVPDVLGELAFGRASSIGEAVGKLGLKSMSEGDIRSLVAKVVEENRVLIADVGERAFSQLMGKVMEVARGKVDGKRVSALLKEKLSDSLKDAKRRGKLGGNKV